MKKDLSSTLIIFIFFLIFSITACSSQSDSKLLSEVSFSLSSQTCEKIMARAAEKSGEGKSLTLKVSLILLSENESKNESLDITKNVKGPLLFSFTEIPVGTKVKAKAWIYYGEEEFAYGESDEIEVKENDNKLSLKLKYSKELAKDATIVITIDDETSLSASEITLEAVESSVKPSNNAASTVEYEVFNISPLAADQSLLQGFDLTWAIDGFEENEKGMSLKVYKDLLSSGPHTVSLVAKNADKKYFVGEIEVSVEREKEERIVFVSTERGLEFRINRFTSDEYFENTRLKELDSDIQIIQLYEKAFSGWKGYWPFVKPDGEYQFLLEGSVNSDSYSSITLDPVTYLGQRNTPITSAMIQKTKAFKNEDLTVDSSEAYPKITISEEDFSDFKTFFDIYKNDPYLKVTKSFASISLWTESWQWLLNNDYSINNELPASLEAFDFISDLPEDSWGKSNALSKLNAGDKFFVMLEPCYIFNDDKYQFFKLADKKSATNGENMAVWPELN